MAALTMAALTMAARAARTERTESCLLTLSGAPADDGPSVGLRPAARIERPGRAALRGRVQALDTVGSLALLGVTELAPGEEVTLVLGKGLRIEMIVTEQRGDRAMVRPRTEAETTRLEPSALVRHLLYADGLTARCTVTSATRHRLVLRTDAPLAVGEAVRVGRDWGRVARADADGYLVTLDERPQTPLRAAPARRAA